MKEFLLIATILATLPNIVRASANEHLVDPINPIFPVADTTTVTSSPIEIHDIIFGGSDCPTDKPIIMSDKENLNLKFPDILTKKTNTSFVSCNYRLAIKTSDPKKKFKITGAKFSLTRAQFTKKSTIEVVVNSGVDREILLLKPTEKSVNFTFQSQCSNTAILGAGINIISKNEIASLQNPMITLKIEPCKP